MKIYMMMIMNQIIIQKCKKMNNLFYQMNVYQFNKIKVIKEIKV